MASPEIALANERMSIIAACNEIGMNLGEFTFGSMKLYCPFGEVFHADGGQSKAFRVYPNTNSAYCFACVEFYSPVKLLARAKDLPEEVVAEQILTETGYVPPDYASQWEALMQEQESVDRDGLADALKAFCARVERQWDDRQFDSPVSAMLVRCLSLLPQVRTADQATKWLARSKQAMELVLGGRTDGRAESASRP